MQILTTILYILLFLVFLSILIIIHELGHLAVAKAFHVYCLEYSIGMGPAIFKIKKKNWETQFTLRAIPFGGYVSMYGEGVELPEGVVIDESRSLNGIKPWKRSLVLLAGVTMNALLALVFFFAANCFPQESLDYINHVHVEEGSLAYIAGLEDDGYIKFDEWRFYDAVEETRMMYYLVDNGTLFNDDTNQYATCFNFSSLKNFQHLDYSEYIYIYEAKPAAELGDVYTVIYSNDASFNFLVKGHNDNENPEIKIGKNKTWEIDGVDTNIEDIYADDKKISVQSISKVDMGEKLIPVFEKYVEPSFENAEIHITKKIRVEDDKLVDGDTVTINISQTDGIVDSFGLSIFHLKYRYTFPQMVGHTFSDFGNCSVVLFRTIGDLFTKPSTWENIGGIVAVGFETTSVLQNFGFGKFLFYWGFISVNLAIFNLLPFPGLDGWQLLVLIIESTTRKKIPDKVKNIVSFIGIALLLTLMAVVVVKDVIKYIFLVL